MKKGMIILASAMLLTGCKQNGQSVSTESDSVAIAEMVEEVVSTYRAELTKDSIGAIAIGAEMHTLPHSVEGLYDQREPGASADALTMMFRQNGEDEFLAYDFGEGKIDVINAVGRGVKVVVPEGEIGLGDRFSMVLSLPGVKPEWTGYDDGGMWYWVWEGIWFAPNQESLPEELSKLLYNSNQAPEAKDFPDTITVGFLGTGLPF